MPCNAFVPVAWVTSALNGEALRLLILISSYADAQTGECWPNNATLSEALNKTPRAIQISLRELQTAGFISMVEPASRRRKIRIESPEWYDKPRRKPSRFNHEGNLHGSAVEPRRKPSPNHEGNLHPNHEGNLHPPNKNTPIEHTQEHNGGESFAQESKPERKSPAAAAAGNLEPFESGLPAELPVVRNGFARQRTRAVEIVPTQFRSEQRQRMVELFGIESNEFARLVSQQMADSGFLEWVLAKSETAKNPIALAVTLIKRAWREGWTNPNAANDAEYAELVEFMKELQK